MPAQTFAIAKPVQYDRWYFVTAIRMGGLRIDNILYDPDARSDARHMARRWNTAEAAHQALDKLHTVGGFDDYGVVAMGSAT